MPWHDGYLTQLIVEEDASRSITSVCKRIHHPHIFSFLILMGHTCIQIFPSDGCIPFWKWFWFDFDECTFPFSPYSIVTFSVLHITYKTCLQIQVIIFIRSAPKNKFQRLSYTEQEKVLTFKLSFYKYFTKSQKCNFCCIKLFRTTLGWFLGTNIIVKIISKNFWD